MGFTGIDWNPGPAKLRSFGLAMIAGFGLLGAAFFFGFPAGESRVAACVLWAAGGSAGILGLTGTKAARPPYFAWMSVALVTGTITGTVTLTLLYYTLITGTGLVMRIAGRDRLGLRKAKSGTYWSEIRHFTDPARYERQF